METNARLAASAAIENAVRELRFMHHTALAINELVALPTGTFDAPVLNDLPLEKGDVGSFSLRDGYARGMTQDAVVRELFAVSELHETLEDLPACTVGGAVATTAVARCVDAYFEALPFSPTERRWLSEACASVGQGGLGDKTVDEIEPDWDPFPVLRRQVGAISVRGVQRQVSGAALADRWWRWKCGADEYRGASTYQDARAALGELSVLLSSADFEPWA